MKNLSRRDPANVFLILLNLVVFTFALVGTVLTYVNPAIWKKLMDLPSLPPALMNHPWFPYAAPALLALSFGYFLTGYVFHPGQGKLRHLYVLEGSGGPWMYAFDGVGVHEYGFDYNTNPKIDYVKERFQIVDLKRGKVTWKKQVKSKRDSRLVFLGLRGDKAFFKSRNLGQHAVDLTKGQWIPEKALKTESLETAPVGDQTAKRVQSFKLPTGEVVELKGQGDGKELWVNGMKRGSGSYDGASLYHNDAPGMRPAFLENPRSVVVGHFKRIGGRKNWCLTRIGLATGEGLWTLEERKLSPKKIKSDEGTMRLQSLYAGRDVVVVAFTTPRQYEDVAFRIDAKTGRPLWKYVF